MKVIGAGLACLDIINEGEKISVMNGGTCANVLTALTQLGEETTMLLPKYINDIRSKEFYLAFEKLDVGMIFYGDTKQNIPRIVETYDENHRHIFYTKCPQCNKELTKSKFISHRESQTLVDRCQGYDIFFTDRISGGIKEIAKEFNRNGAKVFYEPNSGRNIKALVEMAKLSNVLKFSTERISMRLIDEVLPQCQDAMLEVVIATHGKKGMSFCYKTSNGDFSNWIEGPYIEFRDIRDTSGAGDWLTAGFLHYWSQEKFKISEIVLYNILKCSLNLSEISSMTKGAQGAFYDKKVLERLKREYKVKLVTPLEQCEEFIKGKNYCGFCLSENDE